MKLKISFILLVLTFGFFLPERTAGQLRVPRSVLANGGTELTGSVNSIVGTVGQPLIGVASGSAHILNGGFWYAQANAMMVHITPPGTDVVIQPEEYALHNNYPNPFNPETVIDYALPIRSDVKLTIYNLRGEEVALLVDGTVSAGNHRVIWDASGFVSGVYMYRLQARPPGSRTGQTDVGQAGDFVQTRKMVLLK